MIPNLWTPNFLMDGWWAVAMAVLVVWSVAWKGIALWKSARSSQRNWFIALLIINTVGILEILYIFVFFKMKPNSTEVMSGKKSASPKTSKKEASTKEEI